MIRYSPEFKQSLVEMHDQGRSYTVLMSILWTGFFGTERCRTPKIFQKPDFSLKRRHFSVFCR